LNLAQPLNILLFGGSGSGVNWDYSNSFFLCFANDFGYNWANADFVFADVSVLGEWERHLRPAFGK